HANKWPAFEKWTLEFFKTQIGEQMVPVRDYCEIPYRKTTMPMKEYMDYFEALPESGPGEGRNLYLAEWNFPVACPQLMADFEVPSLFGVDWIDRLPKSLQFGRTWIFIGHPTVHTPAHTDSFHSSAWLAMLQGQKILRLIRPEHGAKLFKGI